MSDRLKFIGPATIVVQENFCFVSALLENDERVEFCLDSFDMNMIVNAWLERDRPATQVPGSHPRTLGIDGPGHEKLLPDI